MKTNMIFRKSGILPQLMKFAFMDKVCHKKQSLLPDGSAEELVTSFNDYFVQKITRIRKDLDDQHRDLPIDLPELDPDENDHQFSEFDDVSPEQVEKIIKSASSATCTLDPITTWILKQCFPELLPTITRIQSIVGIWRISATDEECISETCD